MLVENTLLNTQFTFGEYPLLPEQSSGEAFSIGEFIINLQGPDDSITPVAVSLDETIGSLKKKMTILYPGLPEESMAFICNRIALVEGKTLTEQNVRCSSLVQLILTTMHSGGAKAVFEFDFNKCEKGAARLRDFAETGPRWRTVKSGLNLLGKCKKEGCEAHKQFVYIQKGFGTFDMAWTKHEARCPICAKKAEDVTNVVFVDCTYKIRGLQIIPGRDRPKKSPPHEGETTAGKYTTFDQGNNCKWQALEITTEIKKNK